MNSILFRTKITKLRHRKRKVHNQKYNDCVLIGSQRTQAYFRLQTKRNEGCKYVDCVRRLEQVWETPNRTGEKKEEAEFEGIQ